MSIPRDVIVIGAAEGGLEPLTNLARTLPASLPAAVLVALHAHPQSLGALKETMSSHSGLSVSYASEGQEIASGHIYLTPPDCQLIVRAPGVLGLEARAASDEARPSIDRLFRSAAEVFDYRVIGVILSGRDGDGTDGMKAIEEADGIGIVQDPEDAAVAEMPSHALAHDSPHYVAPLEGIAALLVTLTGQKRSSREAGLASSRRTGNRT